MFDKIKIAVFIACLTPINVLPEPTCANSVWKALELVQLFLKDDLSHEELSQQMYILKQGFNNSAYEEDLRALKGRIALLESEKNVPADNVSLDHDWKSISNNLSKCMNRGFYAMRQANLSEVEQIGKSTIVGKMGIYKSSIRCITQKKIVIFVSAGQEYEKAASINKNLKLNF